MKRHLVPLVAFVLTTVCALPVMGQWLPEYQPEKTNNKVEKFVKEKATLAQIEQEFMRAVRKGDTATVKKLVEENPYTVLLRKRMQSQLKDSKYWWEEKHTQTVLHAFVLPICIAAGNGHNELIKYMAKKDPSLLKVRCENSDGNLVNVAIENKHFDTATMLLKMKVSPNATLHHPDWTPLTTFIMTAWHATDLATLKKLIPALLDMGADPNAQFGYICSSTDDDAFYKAAEVGNVNFITVLRDELKKRGKNPVSKCTSHGVYHSAITDSTEGKLLRKYGVEVEVRDGYNVIENGVPGYAD